MSLQLYVAIENARHTLQEALPLYGSGKLVDAKVPHGMGILFRQLGTCRMLVDGVAAPLFAAQMQSASAYLFGLRTLADDHKVTSLAGCWWDSIAGGYWDAARGIALASRTTHNPSFEHEDDFLYVSFLMHRFFLDTAGKAQEQEQEDRLDRWEAVLEGGSDPKLDLCRALHLGDAEAFQEALLDVGARRAEMLERKHAAGKIEAEKALWVKPVWPEGLSLLRLAAREGLAADLECPAVPSLLRVDPPFRYGEDAWRNIDFQPTAR